MRKIRLKLSNFLFFLGKSIHPDFSELQAKIKKANEEIRKYQPGINLEINK